MDIGFWKSVAESPPLMDRLFLGVSVFFSFSGVSSTLICHTSERSPQSRKEVKHG